MNTTGEPEAGRELDLAIAGAIGAEPAGGDVPPYSTEMAAAWRLVERLEPLVCRFDGADGTIWVGRGDWADLSLDGEPCVSRPSEDDELAEDPEPYAAHIHLGGLAEGPAYPPGWGHGRRFCARAASAPLAISRAVLQALT